MFWFTSYNRPSELCLQFEWQAGSTSACPADTYEHTALRKGKLSPCVYLAANDGDRLLCWAALLGSCTDRISCGPSLEGSSPSREQPCLLHSALQLKGSSRSQTRPQMQLVEPVPKWPMNWKGFLVGGKSSGGLAALLQD